MAQKHYEFIELIYRLKAKGGLIEYRSPGILAYDRSGSELVASLNLTEGLTEIIGMQGSSQDFFIEEYLMRTGIKVNPLTRPKDRYLYALYQGLVNGKLCNSLEEIKQSLVS